MVVEICVGGILWWAVAFGLALAVIAVFGTLLAGALGLK